MTALLERQRHTKEAIVAQLKRLAEIAESVGMLTLSGDLQVSRIPKIENELFHLVVLGEFNHGKSTFVNALLGEEILPTGITPTTAALNHVRYGKKKSARAFKADGSSSSLALSKLGDWVTTGGKKTKEVSYVEVTYPAPLLEENIILVDTPGVNDLNEQRAEITYGYVPRADAVIFLLDATQALSDSEKEFLASHVLEGTRDRLVFVVGKADLLKDEEKTTVLKYVKDKLSELVEEPAVFPLSARDWLAGDVKGSGAGELLAYLDRFLDTDRVQVLLDNAAVDATRTAAYLEQNLELKRHAFDLDLSELEERVASIREQLDTSKRALDQLHERIRTETGALKAHVRLDLDAFARQFAEAMPGQIDRVNADDVKTYLGGFVEDKFKSWAELEGAKIASQLESLAEDVIAVTNENVAAAGRAVASRLGPSDTEVTIDVDSFKYDVGVYALGALGTTVFLFVNTLAGGLLTLAAPILAIVVKSKIAGDIREQAKARVPEAILKAADAMAPHFDNCIDDFAERLSAFVSSAGNTLYRGISEILDQTIEERRAREGDVDALREETQHLVDAVAEVHGELDTLRSAVWAPGNGDGNG